MNEIILQRDETGFYTLCGCGWTSKVSTTLKALAEAAREHSKASGHPFRKHGNDDVG